MNYEYYNANPMGRNIEDCVLRSISVLTNRSWEEVNDELSYLAAKQGYMFDNVPFVGEFAKEHPYGKYAITMAGHITALIDGVIIDTFDPSYRIMRCAWIIE